MSHLCGRSLPPSVDNSQFNINKRYNHLAGRQRSGLPSAFNVSSSGGARDAWPTAMGVYRITKKSFQDYLQSSLLPAVFFDENLNVYKHETEERYLYMDLDRKWVIHDEVTLNGAYLYAACLSYINCWPHTTKWLYGAGILSDPSLTVQSFGGKNRCNELQVMLREDFCNRKVRTAN